jgi:nanoRNase/pAp phosphatase (c-di-AMP/oligoRNAs hydrolase)
VADDRALRVKIVRQLARKKVGGGHKKQVDTVKN